jgi:type III secretion protein N (ATPase)
VRWLEAGARRAALERGAALELVGRITGASGLALEAVVPGLSLGALVEMGTRRGTLRAEVVGLREERAVLLPLGEATGVAVGSEVRSAGEALTVGAGEGLLGRVLDGLGRPADGRPPPAGLVPWAVDRSPPEPLVRPPITAPLPLGVRALDGLVTVGVGQRLGLFAGPGVGKSSLLGRLARSASADVTVACLVGERGREVGEFVAEALGADGQRRAVVVAATGDAPALVRLRAAHVATALAEWFADRGAEVLLLVDSLTRFARAQREVGLAAGEPPARQGYPPSVFQALPRLLERAGRRPRGGITGLYTVLVAGGDLEEPVADEARGLLDGHVVLDRRLAEEGRFPAIDVLASVSRVMGRVASAPHRAAAARVRRLLAAHERARDLILMGAYRAGADPEVDRAVAAMPAIEAFLRDAAEPPTAFEATLAALEGLAP